MVTFSSYNMRKYRNVYSYLYLKKPAFKNGFALLFFNIELLVGYCDQSNPHFMASHSNNSTLPYTTKERNKHMSSCSQN
jgi:hypothetical protein